MVPGVIPNVKQQESHKGPLKPNHNLSTGRIESLPPAPPDDAPTLLGTELLVQTLKDDLDLASDNSMPPKCNTIDTQDTD